MGFRKRMRPPRPLLALLLACSLSSAVALTWAGWNLIGRERAAEAHELRQLADALAERLPALLRAQLAAAEARLAAWMARPPQGIDLPPGELLIVEEGRRLEAYPPGRLLYYPSEPAVPDRAPPRFAAAEQLEFQMGQAAAAAASYRRLISDPDPATRAGALLRLARVANNLGQHGTALQAYEQLASLHGAQLAAPAAHLAMAGILTRVGRQDAARQQAHRLRRGLESGEWRLTRGQFEFYWPEAARLSGAGGAVPPSSALSEAVREVCIRWRETPEVHGAFSVRANGSAWAVSWMRSGNRTAAMLLNPAGLLAPHHGDGRLRLQLLDAEGRLVAGERGSATPVSIRLAAQTGLPWSLAVVHAQPLPSRSAGGERFITLVLAAAIVFIALATWLMARLIQREAAVARLQSDFVSAVSHEFRSPLTAMRHLSEMLALGRVAEEGRRQRYYETLAAETRRLQRLVETLLNFGRMEAGAQPYRFERVDAAALATRVAAEFEPQVQPQGRSIEVSGAADLWLDADEEALGVALRNLLDNALKYSPGRPTVWVDCAGDAQEVTIRVRDEGVGIPRQEQRLIFQRFVRGTSAGEVEVSGTGVGLAMVQHIVRAHGGRIELESEPGRGSMFTLFLPAAKAL